VYDAQFRAKVTILSRNLDKTRIDEDEAGGQ